MILEPPHSYVRSYSGPITEWVMTASQVDAYCRSAGAVSIGQIVGCQFFVGKHCFIVLSEHAVEILRRHERAHCNGWRHQ